MQYVRHVAGDAAIENFVASQLNRNRNLWYSELINLLGNFNSGWATSIKENIDTKTRTALDGLVRLRNNISHGDEVNISLTNLLSYFESSQEIIRLVYETCESNQ